MFRTLHRPVTSVLAFLLGCGGNASDSGRPSGTFEPGVTYRLVLEPVLPSNQLDLLEGAAGVELTLDRPDGQEVLDLFEIEGGFAAQDLGLLSDTTLSFAARDASGTLLAFGETPPLTVEDGEDRTISFLVAAPGERAAASALGPGLAAGALVADGRGRFLLFGGSRAAGLTSGTDTVQALDLTSTEAALRFSSVGTLPPLDGDASGRAGHSAVLLTGDHSDQGKILVTGGAADLFGTTQVSGRSLLWDPDSDTHEELSQSVADGTMLHTAVEGPEGNVFFVGGFPGSDDDASFAFSKRAFRYEAATRLVSEIQTGSAQSFFANGAAARLLATGVLVCGGVDITAPQSTFRVSEGCDLLRPNGVLTPLEQPGQAMHAGLFLHELTTLQDGRVLLTGGIEAQPGTDLSEDAVFPATNEAWIFDGEAWEQVGSLSVARALHSTALLPDGRVLVVGGVSENEGSFLQTDAALACAEIFDPVTETFALRDPSCSAASSSGYTSQPAALASVAGDSRGVLVAGGLNAAGSPISDVSYFFVPDAE